jgi:UDP-glucose:(heptosyl)LPS alpha-1,3-glucosyltransferase
MRLAFCIAKYFPFGGLQRNFLRIAQYCQSQGHDIVVYTRAWEGDPIPTGLQVHIIPVKAAISNHRQDWVFSRKLQPLLAQGNFQGVIGFNKMPGLDIFYAADPCFKARRLGKRHFFYRLTSRYRHFVALEKAVFGAANNTQILMLTESQITPYQTCYGTPRWRFHLLPPGIDPKYRTLDNPVERRTQLRRNSGIANDEWLVLLIGTDFRRKGLDRVLKGIAALPEGLKKKIHLWVVGQSPAKIFKLQAAYLGIFHRVRFIRGCTDMSHFLLAADLLVHPAYIENTGNVLLEAMIAGLPVLTTVNCGYAYHVERAEAGKVLPLPFQQTLFNTALLEMLQSPKRSQWSQNGIRYGRQHDLYSRPRVAMEKILAILKIRQHR